MARFHGNEGSLHHCPKSDRNGYRFSISLRVGETREKSAPFCHFLIIFFFFGFSFLWVGRNRMEHESIVGSITLVSWWKTAVGNRKGGQEMRIMASGKCPNLVFFFSNKKGSVKGKSIAKRNTPIAWNPCDNESFHRIQLQVSAKLDLDVFKSSYNNTYSIRCYAI